jgi:hypothetical protein
MLADQADQVGQQDTMTNEENTKITQIIDTYFLKTFL